MTTLAQLCNGHLRPWIEFIYSRECIDTPNGRGILHESLPDEIHFDLVRWCKRHRIPYLRTQKMDATGPVIPERIWLAWKTALLLKIQSAIEDVKQQQEEVDF